MSSFVECPDKGDKFVDMKMSSHVVDMSKAKVRIKRQNFLMFLWSRSVFSQLQSLVPAPAPGVRASFRILF